ncbi:MAG TPA: rRNA maturation RNase YbeY [Candidatus Omnitrophota bacterium]|nr:rRNA maturation RNase YbeY [Candidatus Omnitrophota bacterium]
MKTQIDVRNLQTRIPLRPHLIAAKVKKFLSHEGIAAADLSIAIVSDSHIKSLNQKYLKHDYATDVLAFNLASSCIGRAHGLYGEVVVSADTAKRQSKVFKTTVSDELLLYIIHGILHLLGFDDHSAKDITRMRAKEKAVLARLKKK